MKYNPFTVQKQTGKQTAIVAAGPIGNSNSSAVLTRSDTLYYQIAKNNDYIQDNGSK